jgi:hypothetical protein
MTLRFRNLDFDPTVPLDQWPAKAIETLIDHGSLTARGRSWLNAPSAGSDGFDAIRAMTQGYEVKRCVLVISRPQTSSGDDPDAVADDLIFVRPGDLE